MGNIFYYWFLVGQIVAHFLDPQTLNCLWKKTPFVFIKLPFYENSSLSMKCPIHGKFYLRKSIEKKFQ